MRTKPILPGFAPLLAMGIAIIATFGLDYWLFLQRQNAHNTFDPNPLLAWIIVNYLIHFVIWLALSIITLIWSKRSVIVAIIFVISGFVLAIYPSLSILIPWMPIPPLIRSTFGTGYSYTGLLIAILGSLNLLLPSRNT